MTSRNVIAEIDMGDSQVGVVEGWILGERWCGKKNEKDVWEF